MKVYIQLWFEPTIKEMLLKVIKVKGIVHASLQNINIKDNLHDWWHTSIPVMHKDSCDAQHDESICNRYIVLTWDIHGLYRSQLMRVVSR